MNTEPYKQHIVFTTLNNPAPQIFTLSNNLSYEDAEKFFDTFCDSIEEIVAAVLFGKTGEFVTTFNGG